METMLSDARLASNDSQSLGERCFYSEGRSATKSKKSSDHFPLIYTIDSKQSSEELPNMPSSSPPKEAKTTTPAPSTTTTRAARVTTISTTEEPPLDIDIRIGTD